MIHLKSYCICTTGNPNLYNNNSCTWTGWMCVSWPWPGCTCAGSSPCPPQCWRNSSTPTSHQHRRFCSMSVTTKLHNKSNSLITFYSCHKVATVLYNNCTTEMSWYVIIMSEQLSAPWTFFTMRSELLWLTSVCIPVRSQLLWLTSICLTVRSQLL